MITSVFDNFAEDRVVLKEKQNIIPHPWEKTIKPESSSKIKHAHNSIKNPVYPRPKQKPDDQRRVKLKVVGDRISKEFIYCSKLVKDLYNYRRKNFSEPIIRGVTSFDWPETLRNARLADREAFCTKTRVLVYFKQKGDAESQWKLLGDDADLKDYIKDKYQHHVRVDYYKQGIANFAEYVKGSGRPCAYMHISIDEEYAGTFIFMLYSDIVPRTCENFLRLCESKRGGYSGAPVHRIVKDCWIQFGGYRLRGSNLTCENFAIPPDRRGVIAMCNDGRDVQCSTQFFILLQPAEWMAHKYVVFGKIIEGESLLKKLEKLPTWYQSPLSEIIITDAGILNMDCQKIIVARSTTYHISKHIEDLGEFGNVLVNEIMCRLKKEIEEKQKKKERKETKESKEAPIKEIELKQKDSGTSLTVTGDTDEKESRERLKFPPVSTPSLASSSSLDKRKQDKIEDFDVESYVPEEYSDPQMDYNAALTIAKSLVSHKLQSKPNPYYLPLTDVLCDDDADSDYKETKMLTGSYCLGIDIDKQAEKKREYNNYMRLSYVSDIFLLESDNEYNMEGIDEDEEEEIKNYLINHGDRVSFAGGVIRNIGKGMALMNLFESARKSEMISFTDDDLRMLRRISTIDRRLSMASRRMSVLDDDMKRLRTISALSDRQPLTDTSRQSTLRDEDIRRIRRMSLAQKQASPAHTPDVPDARRRRSVAAHEHRMSVAERRMSMMPGQKNEMGEEDIARLRRISMIADAQRRASSKKVSISANYDHRISQLQRRPTAFITDPAMQKAIAEASQKKFAQEHGEDDDDDEDKEKRRQTFFAQDESLEKVHTFERDQSKSQFHQEPDHIVQQQAKPTKQKKGEDMADHKVHLTGSDDESGKGKIKRRPTGYVRKSAVPKDDEEDGDEGDEQKLSKRRGTAFVRKQDVPDIDEGEEEFIEEEMTEGDHKEIAKRRGTGFVRKQDLPPDEYEEEEQEIEQVETVEKQKPAKRRPTGFVRKKDIPEDEEELEQEVMEESKPSKTKAKRRATGYVGSLPTDEEDSEDDLTPLKLDDKKKAAGFAADEDLEKIRIMSKLGVNKADTDSDIDDEHKVHMSASTQDRHSSLKRRPTGFVAAMPIPDDEDEEDDNSIDDARKSKSKQASFLPLEELEKIKLISKIGVNVDVNDADDEEDNIKEEETGHKRRPTGFVRGVVDDDDDDDDDGEIFSLPPIEDNNEQVVAQVFVAPQPFSDVQNEQESSTTKLPRISQDPRRSIAFPSDRTVPEIKIFHRDSSSDSEVYKGSSDRVESEIVQEEERRSYAVKHSSEIEARRKSALTRLLIAAKHDVDETPTLKNYRPTSERLPMNLFLTPTKKFPPLMEMEDPSEQEKHLRESFDSEVQKLKTTEILEIQHGPKISAVISSDYVQTLDMTERPNLQKSLRSLEYARSRPTLTVEQYQEKNRKYKQQLQMNQILIQKETTATPKKSSISSRISTASRSSRKIRPPKMRADIMKDIENRRKKQ